MSDVKSRFLALLSILFFVAVILGLAAFPQKAFAAVDFVFEEVEYEITSPGKVKAVGATGDFITVYAKAFDASTSIEYDVAEIKINSPDLVYLGVDAVGAAISSIDVSGCTKLETVFCSGINLESLNVKNCSQLKILSCYSNNLKELDVSTNSVLEEIQCSHNILTELDLTNNTELRLLDCSYNTAISQLNVSHLANLRNLYCDKTGITTLDVSGLSHLSELYCSENGLTSLSFEGCGALKILQCCFNSISSLDLSGCSALEFLDCHGNLLSTLNVMNFASLKTLFCSFNNLSVLDLSGCVSLEELNCGDNLFLNPIKGIAKESLTSWDFRWQYIAIPMSHDGKGGYVSENSYPLAKNVVLENTSVVFSNEFFLMPDGWSGDSFYESFSGYTHTQGPMSFSDSLAAFYLPQYSVTFLDYDETSLETQFVESGAAAVAPKDPVRDGYTFAGWDTSFDRVTADITVTALYEKNVDPVDPVDPQPTDSKALANTGDSSRVVVWILALSGILSAVLGLVLRKRARD